MKPNLKHELRTPLNHIIGYSEMILEECRNGEHEAWQASLQRIHDHGLRLLDLVERCLASNTHPRPNLSPELETRVEQILIKVRELRSPKDSSCSHAQDQDLGRIALAADRLRILASTLTHADQPKRLGPPGSQPRRFRKSPEGSLPQPGSVRQRLLVVDDDEGNREMLTRRLIRLGYTVRTASDGLQALAELGSEPVDLVLLDLQMPEMDGFEALLRIRTNTQWARFPSSSCRLRVTSSAWRAASNWARRTTSRSLSIPCCCRPASPRALSGNCSVTGKSPTPDRSRRNNVAPTLSSTPSPILGAR